MRRGRTGWSIAPKIGGGFSQSPMRDFDSLKHRASERTHGASGVQSSASPAPSGGATGTAPGAAAKARFQASSAAIL